MDTTSQVNISGEGSDELGLPRQRKPVEATFYFPAARKRHNRLRRHILYRLRRHILSCEVKQPAVHSRTT